MGSDARPGTAPAASDSAGGMVREGAFLTSLTLFGKFTGFGREWLLAFFFGTGIITDAFRIAVDLSRNLYQVIIGNQVETTLIPLLAKWRTRGKTHARDMLFRLVAWISLAIAGIVAVLVAVFASFITQLQVPGYSPEDAAVVTFLIRWVAPSVPLHVACYLVGYLLGSVHRFRVFSALPAMINVVVIFATISVGAGWISPAWLSIAYSVAALFALAVLLWDAYSYLPGPVRTTLDRALTLLKPFFIAYWPLLVLSFVTQSRIFLDKRIVSDLGVGSVAALYYARIIIETPSATAGFALIRMILPRFSEMVALKKTDELAREFLLLLEGTLWMLLPGVALIAAGAKPLVVTLFGYGAFDESAAATTSLALLGAAPVLWTSVAIPLVNRVFNAQGTNRVLLGVGVVGTAGNVALAYALSRVIGVAGIGLAQGIAQFAMVAYLLPSLPGGIAWKSFARIGLWWILAGILYLALHWLPRPETAILELLELGFVGVGGWIALSMIFPRGRAFVRKARQTLARRGSGK